jgi:hypothetical protein
MLLGFPKKFLKAFTSLRIFAGVAPDASNTCGAAEAPTGLKIRVKPRVAIAGKSECLTRAANVRFEVSNGGVVPRRLVIELVIDCMDCIVLVDVEVLLSFWPFRRVFFEPVLSSKAEIPTETRHSCRVFFKPPCAVLY